MAKVQRSRWQTRLLLHGIARPHLHYPPLEVSWWFIPEVRRWEVYQPGDDVWLTRAERRLVGRRVVPSYVLFPVMPEVYLTTAHTNPLRLHLQSLTGYRWEVHKLMVSGSVGWLPVERIVSMIELTDDDDDSLTYVRRLYATPNIRRPFWRELVGGLFNDEWRRAGRELDTREEDYTRLDG